MIYKKLNPEITFDDFFKLSKTFKSFESLKGHKYLVKDWNNSIMTFERLSTNKVWKMDIRNVYQAYIELESFRTSDFKSYVSRTHSPALGLILTLKLLEVRNIS